MLSAYFVCDYIQATFVWDSTQAYFIDEPITASFKGIGLKCLHSAAPDIPLGGFDSGFNNGFD